jgi:hypothetical protein
MKDNMKPTPQQTQTESIRDRVFSTIDEQNMEPRPCYVFWCQNSAMWMIWLLTVVLGGLATAVLLFTSTYRYYDIYEAVHDNFVTFFLQALPLLWILAFIVLMVVAMQGLRATRRGYRLSPVLVGGSSVGASVLLGVAASSLGFGFVVDRTLGEYAPMYYSEAKREQQMWQQPSEGRLIGSATADALPEQPQISFIDSAGAVWTLDVQELQPQDKQLLESKQRVRVLGTQVSTDPARFHACGVFPWMLDKKRAMSELSAERQAYVDKIYAHADTLVDRLRKIEDVTFNNTAINSTASAKICAEIAAVRRISEQMR